MLKLNTAEHSKIYIIFGIGYLWRWSFHILLFKYGINNWNWYFVVVIGFGIFEVKLELVCGIGVELEFIQCPEVEINFSGQWTTTPLDSEICWSCQMWQRNRCLWVVKTYDVLLLTQLFKWTSSVLVV